MADAIVIDVVQEVSRILTARKIVVDELKIDLTNYGPTWEDIKLDMMYHECKADSSEGRLGERKWSLSGGDDVKELVSIVLESTNVKAIFMRGDSRPDTHDVIQQFLQGLYTNHTIVSASFHLRYGNTAIDVLDKYADMLSHNVGLKHFSLRLPYGRFSRTKHSGFGNVLKMNHTLQSLTIQFYRRSLTLDLEELVQPLIMDENGHQANSTLTSLRVNGLSGMSSVGATFARMLRKNSSIKYLVLGNSLETESDVQELIQSLVENHSLETLNLRGCAGVRGSVFPAIMDVLRVNLTLKDIELRGTILDREGKGLAIEEQLRRNAMSKALHLKELEMAKPTSARVIFCGSPYAGMS